MDLYRLLVLAERYKNRYGLVRLELASQRRTIKKSGYWFAETARQNGFD